MWVCPGDGDGSFNFAFKVSAHETPGWCPVLVVRCYSGSTSGCHENQGRVADVCFCPCEIRGSNQSVRYCSTCHPLTEQLSGIKKKEESSCFSAPPPPPPLSPLSLAGLMNEVFSQSCQSVAAVTHGAWEEKWQDAALSPRLSSLGQSERGPAGLSGPVKRRRAII